MSKAEWSGWAQAVGATVSVLIAIWVPWNQGRAARKEAINVAEHFALRLEGLSLRLTLESQVVRRNALLTCREKLKMLIQQAALIRLDLLPIDRLNALLELQSIANATLQNIHRQLGGNATEVSRFVTLSKLNHDIIKTAAQVVRYGVTVPTNGEE
ncbi:hypothetical protein OU995_21405 [Roseateles sp. SL47]|uniref:hypothetical protein n=1 Tax=Roseateles sp. SL47 TaxID=2995138 RepID=UPI00226DC5EF|nr:hypothetical protein [Roseateles sp. SL47]WAC72101.1 hypothetical protein OU995_21405 [Roseateles sp. SL47]